MLKLILLPILLIALVRGHGPGCYLPVVPGTSVNCTNSSSIRYHFDPYVNECHAFPYNGCGGNANNYETPGDCIDKCIGDWRKYFQCSLGKKPIFNDNGSPQCPVADSETSEGCKDTALCVNFYTIGLCCNKTVEVGLAADKSATCPSGKARYQIDGNTVLAKVCADVTCPSGYSCETGNFFAYCCQD
ncbi:unnamed protein product [Caenorhabditis sp. 36 PRJEB53466]|nr:unnamed protein product [Caenorhabditis sp. 36 PRJEB53466]